MSWICGESGASLILCSLVYGCWYLKIDGCTWGTSLDKSALTNQGHCVGFGNEPSQHVEIQMALQTHTSLFKNSEPQKVFFKTSSYFMVPWKWSVQIFRSSLTH